MPTGGQLVGEALAKEGVRVVFTLCGGHILPIYEGCLDHDIRVIDVRHEQTAAFAADGWARVTGEAGVAAVTAGPPPGRGRVPRRPAWPPIRLLPPTSVARSDSTSC